MITEIQTELLTIDTSEVGAIELSDQDLDCVAGGFSMGDLSSMFSGSESNFSQTHMAMGSQTFAGPQGAGSVSMFEFDKIESSSKQINAFSK